MGSCTPNSHFFWSLLLFYLSIVYFFIIYFPWKACSVYIQRFYPSTIPHPFDYFTNITRPLQQIINEKKNNKNASKHDKLATLQLHLEIFFFKTHSSWFLHCEVTVNTNYLRIWWNMFLQSDAKHACATIRRKIERLQ